MRCFYDWYYSSATHLAPASESEEVGGEHDFPLSIRQLCMSLKCLLQQSFVGVQQQGLNHPSDSQGRKRKNN